MGIAERKQRAFEAREKMVIEHADDLLMDRGYLGLNLDELADRVEYSKATLYHHFVSKEDLVLAVVSNHFAKRMDYFARASRFDGLTRERIFAFGVADRLLSRQYPHGFPLVQLVRQPSIWEKCSEARQGQYMERSGGCFELAIKVAHEAKEKGDLQEWSPTPEQIVWGLVSLSKGAHLLAEEVVFGPAAALPGDPLDFLFDNYGRYLDGAGWKLYGREHDYKESLERIEAQLFAEEVASLVE